MEIIHQTTLLSPFKTCPSSSNINLIKFNVVTLLVIVLLFVSGSLQAQKTLGVTKYAFGNLEKGYIFFAPAGHNKAYLIDKCGKEVRSWTSNYGPGMSAYLLPDGSMLRTGRSQDTTFLLAPGKGGIIERYDWNGNLKWSYKFETDTLCQHHDIFPMPNGNILVLAWHKISYAKATKYGKFPVYTGDELWSESIIELKPQGTNGAQVVWQWNLWDHTIQGTDITKLNYGNVSSHPELMDVNYDPYKGSAWLHANSLDYNADLDQIVISCRNLNEFWIIDHSTSTQQAASHSGGKYGKGGDLLYRWGNPLAYGKGTKKDEKLFNQHSAAWVPKGYTNGGGIMYFNNGTNRDTMYSTVEIIIPPVDAPGVYKTSTPYGPAAPVYKYKNTVPKNFFSSFFSGAQRLPNGNTLICSGTPGVFFELNAKKEIVWEYINPVSDVVLTDGVPPPINSNSAFRCTFYADTFSAFKGKTMTPGSPIELKSVSYSCSFVVPDTTAPKSIGLLPALGSTLVPINTELNISFNENVVKGLTGKINIYENNTLKESIDIGDSKVTLAARTATIRPANVFNYISRISVHVDKGCFRDSSGNLMVAIDSSKWMFHTTKQIGFNDIGNDHPKGIYPNPVTKILHVPFHNQTPEIAIINHVGQFIPFTYKSVTNQEISIDVSHMPNGIYTVLLNGRHAQVFRKE